MHNFIWFKESRGVFSNVPKIMRPFALIFSGEAFSEHLDVFGGSSQVDGDHLNQWEIPDPRMEVLYHIMIIMPYFRGISPTSA